jgi:5-methylcytosine-specific restriction endonuclease McrA
MNTIPLDYIRGLIVLQNGNCAITGMPLDPQDVNADHVIPLSRKDHSPNTGGDNIWLVHKKVNAMKGTMTYEELVKMAKLIIDHHEKSLALLKLIRDCSVKPISKSLFDKWVAENCDSDGKVMNPDGS